MSDHFLSFDCLIIDVYNTESFQVESAPTPHLSCWTQLTKQNPAGFEGKLKNRTRGVSVSDIYSQCPAGGAAGMVSRITGSVGKGLAAITMDKEYQQKRREEMNRPPKDFGESLAKGGKGLLKVPGPV